MWLIINLIQLGKIVREEEKLESYYSRNELPGLDLSNWLSSSTRQGFKPKVSKGIILLAPVDERVARFGAYSDGAGFGCNRYPSGSVASLGYVSW